MKRRRRFESDNTQSSNLEDRTPHCTSSLDRRRVELRCENGHRSSWHGTSPSTSIEQGTSSSDSSRVTVRSQSHGSLQTRPKSRLKLFHRRSYPVNPTPPASPYKDSNISSLRTFFHNIKRGKLKAGKHASKLTKHVDSKGSGSNNIGDATSSKTADGVDDNDDVDGDQTAKKRIRTSPEIDNEESDDSDVAIRGLRVQLIPEGQDLGATCSNWDSFTNKDSDTQRSQPSDLVLTSSEIPRPGPHPIHTFQRPQSRLTLQNQSRTSIFTRSRSKKSVIQEVEDNLTHPVIIAILSVINFVLWVFLLGASIVRKGSVVALWIWLRLLYLFDFFLKLFYRIFNQDPEKANQNSDYTHIEGKISVSQYFK